MKVLNRCFFALGILLCCLRIMYAEEHKSAPVLYAVNFTIEGPSAELPEGQRCIVTIQSAEKKKRVRTFLLLNESRNIYLEKGRYEVNALVHEPRCDATASLDVPETDRVILKLKKAKEHYLKIKVVDTNDMPLDKCRVRISFWSGVVIRGLPSFLDTAGTGKTEITDANALVDFHILGPVPECQVRVLNQYLSQPEVHKIPISSWDNEQPLLLRVSHKSVNGKIQCHFRKDKKVYPFLKGITNLLEENPSYAVARLVRINHERKSKNYLNFRLENDLLPLYGLSDGEYLIRRIDVVSPESTTIIYPFKDDLISIKNGLLSADDKKLIFAHKQGCKTSLSITVTDGRNTIADAGVLVIHPLHNKRLKTDDVGQCHASLPFGKYIVQAFHDKYATVAQEVYIDEKTTTIELQLDAYPVLRGKITLAGKPVQQAGIIALFGFDKHQYSAQSDENGNYEIALKKTGYFVLGVIHDGFAEFQELNTRETTLGTLDIELTPRRVIILNLSGEYRSLIEKESRLFVFPKRIGAPAARFTVSESGVARITVISGNYRVYLFAPENEVYDLGTLKIAQNQSTVEISSDKKAEPISLEHLLKQMRSDFRKGGPGVRP